MSTSSDEQQDGSGSSGTSSSDEGVEDGQNDSNESSSEEGEDVANSAKIPKERDGGAVDKLLLHGHGESAHTLEKCTFDLRNLTAINSHEVDVRALYSSSADGVGVGAAGAAVSANEDFLLEKSAEGCQQLLASIWDLPRDDTKSSDAGPLAILPSSFEIVTPRALPPPPPKKETRWEKFAKERGIQPDRKRDRKVYDKATGEWLYRHGYQKANAGADSNGPAEWPIMEVKKNDNPYEDPWEKAREAKRARVDKNTESRMRNAERSGQLPKGTTGRTVRDKKVQREKEKAGNNAKGEKVVPSGVPVDLKSETTATGTSASVKRGKELTRAALLASQRSTASMGKFDRMREGEPERKAPVRRRKFESAIPSGKKGTAAGALTESDRGMKVLKTVMGGGSKSDRAKKDGSLSKGETAYDYDFDDGLGSGTFRKKKGRAGAGKMRKVTKKRAK